MGMDSCKCIGVGAAPIAMESLEYFLSLDIPLLECYGMSETGGPHTGNRPGHHKLGSIGPSIGECRTKIYNPDSDGEGEIIMSSRNIMMGYLFNEDKTKEAIDEEGWMHSGDLGTQLDNGYFKVNCQYIAMKSKFTSIFVLIFLDESASEWQHFKKPS